MKKKILLLLSIIMVVSLLSSPVSAEGGVKLRSVTFRLGSLTATGTFTGLGGYTEGVTANLVASGIPVVTCSTQGGNQAAGQNPSNVSAGDIQEIPSDLITRKGTAPLDITAEPGPITGTEGGCPNNNWTAEIVFVSWRRATITVTDNVTGDQLLIQKYSCETTRNPDNTGTVSCILVQ